MELKHYFINPKYLGPNNRFPLSTYESWNAEFAALSEEEQRKVLRDRYGRDDEIKETPELISESLKQFKMEIDSIMSKEAYDIASFILPDYIQSDRFRLAFLRADNFNAKAAACRMVTYWERKVDLFGTDKAFNPSISVLDFEESDYAALAAGGVRLLPHLDDHGRALFFNYPGYYYHNVTSMLRLTWFMAHEALFNNNTMSDVIQIKGGVVLAGNGFPVHLAPPFYSLAESQHHASIVASDCNAALPIRGRSYHRIAANEIGRRFFEYILYFIHSRLRPLFSFYNAQNLQQNRIALARCGIPPEKVPFELGGDLQFNYQQWLNDRITEHLASSFRTIRADAAPENDDDGKSQESSAIERLRLLLQTQRMNETSFIQSTALRFPRPAQFP